MKKNEGMLGAKQQSPRTLANMDGLHQAKPELLQGGLKESLSPWRDADLGHARTL